MPRVPGWNGSRQIGVATGPAVHRAASSPVDEAVALEEELPVGVDRILADYETVLCERTRIDPGFDRYGAGDAMRRRRNIGRAPVELRRVTRVGRDGARATESECAGVCSGVAVAGGVCGHRPRGFAQPPVAVWMVTQDGRRVRARGAARSRFPRGVVGLNLPG